MSVFRSHFRLLCVIFGVSGACSRSYNYTHSVCVLLPWCVISRLGLHQRVYLHGANVFSHHILCFCSIHSELCSDSDFTGGCELFCAISPSTGITHKQLLLVQLIMKYVVTATSSATVRSSFFSHPRWGRHTQCMCYIHGVLLRGCDRIFEGILVCERVVALITAQKHNGYVFFFSYYFSSVMALT